MKTETKKTETKKIETKKTRSQEVASDLVALIKARSPLLWIVSPEEARVERYIVEAAATAKCATRVWDVAAGAVDFKDGPMGLGIGDPDGMLTEILSRSKEGSTSDRCVWVLRDLPKWLEGPAMAQTLRRLRNVARELPDANVNQSQTVIVLSPGNVEVPPELRSQATVIDWPLPDRDEVAEILNAVLETNGKTRADVNGDYEAAIDAAVGLSEDEIVACYSKSMVQFRKIDPKVVAKEKKRVIAREKVLEWFDPIPGGLDAVGGLDLLKKWLFARGIAYTTAAREYGLPAPKGALLVGIPGCGKSLSAKAIATAWGIPLLRLDLGALKNGLVGQSEGNIRKAFKTVDAIGRCVLWVDEIEKALQGATTASSDGGVSADALGTVLTWMEERAGGAFVVATANDVSSLPPELMRRFNAVWFVDLPNPSERVEVLAAAIRSYGRKPDGLDLKKIAAKGDGFTGAEISGLVPDAMFTAFADGSREITTEDLLAAAGDVVPLSQTAKTKIASLREWAENKARRATSVTVTKTEVRRGRVVD